MRRFFPFLLFPLALTLGCSQELPRPASPALDDEGQVAEQPEPEAQPEPPAFSFDAARVETGVLRVTGKVEHTKVPATFHLHTATGCAQERKLATMTTGIAFSTALSVEELTEAIACAIDVEVEGGLVQTLAVSPSGPEIGTSRLSLDPGFALVAADLDPRAGHVVRMTVTSPDPIADASITLGGARFGARVVDNDALLEVPARVWASAVLSGERARIDVRSEAGVVDTLEIAPAVSVEPLGGPGDAEGDDGEGC